uniref:membrane-associated guanylate kinase, WW and PDZ domain-containing protein 2-like n=1 Tax=Styela clava TaxID=7725 RepID=UPI00193A66F5|nr:membrane-associated guanylate kinase, WW and PDZ domain-containing protein 2-like [Styela clava]
MASGKRHKHWSDRVHESVVSRNKNGQLNLVIKGGAEEVKFPFFGTVKQDKVIYHSGKIQDGEVLLEVNDQSVAGLTLYDLNNLIKQAKDPVRFKTVKEGQTLTKDLKLYLSERFPLGAVDHDLQAAIRDNLYLRTLPCTTRQPRDGEVDGVDYTFLNVEQFQELEKSGSLLESGLYEGNYYGTPKPPPVPLSSPPHGSQSPNSPSNDIMPGQKPSSEGKRKRNRSSVEMQPLSASSPNGKGSVINSPSSEKSNSQPQTQDNQINDTEKSAIDLPEPTFSSPPPHDERQHSLGPLPDGWEEAATESGDKYYIDHIGQKTSWLDPRLNSAARKPLEQCADDELPHGWERVEDAQYGVYYVDHVEKKTQFDNPVIQAKERLKNQLNRSQGEIINQLPNYQPEKSPQQLHFTSDPSKLEGDLYNVPIEKGSQGFGFTIVGGDEPEEYLQIKSVVPGGPADRTGNIQQGDIIVQVNDICVLGWTHPQVVQLFQSFPINHIVTLQVCRGYPLPFDPDDPSTSIVTTTAIRPEDRPMEEFERQLRELNQQLESVPNFNSQPGAYYASKSMPDIADNKNYAPPGFFHDGGFNGIPTGSPNENHVMRTGSVNSLHASTSQVIQIILKKGDRGFGFTVTDSPQGQRVKQILDEERCQSIREGDIMLEINGIAVQNMPHNNVVEILKDCPKNAEAIFIIQRISPNKIYPQQMEMSPQQQTRMYHPASYGQQGAPFRRPHTLDMPAHENGSVVSAPPTSVNVYHPMGPLLSEFKAKHQAMTSSMNYMENGMNHNYEHGAPMNHMGMIHPGSMDNYIDITVVLQRLESGFGFRILGGDYTDEKVTIGAIVAGGAAEQEGSLRMGDELLSVDGESVVGIGHSQVVSLMGNAARNGIVQLCIRRRVGGAQMPSRSNLGRQQQQQQQQMGSAGHPSMSYYDVVIHRRKHEGFGFVIISSVAKGPEAVPGNHVPHKIGRIIDGSPAARCKQLHVGDRILAVNGVDIFDLHHGQIVNLIKDSGMSIMLRVAYIPSQEDSARNSCFIVDLHRSKKGFGFGIRGGREYNMPLYVLRMAGDGPAAQSGKIQVGDILVQINGHDTNGMLHSEAITCIKHGGSVARLTIRKGNGTVPEIGNDNEGGSPHLPASQSTCSW